MGAQAGWYPQQNGGQRYWDGAAWTEHHLAATSPQRTETTRTPLKALLVVLAAVFAVGVAYFMALFLFSDPAPDPEVQPLEVVVNSHSNPERPCLLNVEQIRAGVHTVTVIGESGYARVRIVNQQQEVVFRTDNAGQRIETDEDGNITGIIGGEAEGEGASAHLEPGTFTVQCHPRDGESGEATLEVLPARPGH
jgi:hypothetical protein